MKHLLIVFWILAPGETRITMDTFDTEAECQVAGIILADLDTGDTRAEWWTCTVETVT